MKKILLIVMLILLLTGCKSLFTYENKKINYLEGKYNVEMKLAKYGVVKLELDADTAPITVTNFMELVREGFYDNNTIHRVKKDFVIQGGKDESMTKKEIKGEFDANGVSNNISHVRGTISMARMGDETSGFDTASTQFFIVQKDSLSLDHYYAAFGRVTEGMNVIDKICDSIKSADEMGTIQDEKEIITIEYIKEIEE